jgi:uncharacterized protein YegL
MPTPQVPLILARHHVPHRLVVPERPPRAGVAVVYSTASGQVVCFDGRPLRRGEQFMSKYRFRYDVDTSDHRRVARIEQSPLPSSGDAYFFEAEVDVGFRVSDPETIVRRNIQDALPVVYGHLIDVFRPITRRHDVQRAADAEDEINALFQRPVVLDEGITVFRCGVRLSPDSSARAYLRQLTGTRRATEVDEVERYRDEQQQRYRRDQLTVETGHQGQLAAITQQARLARDDAELRALANLPENLWGLLTAHLVRHPDETAWATQLYAQHQQALAEQQGVQNDRTLELVKYMLDRGLFHPVDVQGIGAEALQQVRQSPQMPHSAVSAFAPAGTGWHDPLPGRALVVPVYLAVDESEPAAGYLHGLNAGLAGLPAALSQAPDSLDALRLALLGYADDVALRFPMVGLTPGSLVPALTARAGSRLTPVFVDLLGRIGADVDRLKSTGRQVGRPTLIVLTAGDVGDGADWPGARARLTDPGFAYAPNIVACGVGGADPGLVAGLATRSGQAFVAEPGADVGDSVRHFTDFLARFLTHWSRASLTGLASTAIDGPDGFVPARPRGW